MVERGSMLGQTVFQFESPIWLLRFNISFLKFLGKIETYKKEWATEGERMPIMKRKDNLKFEGHFEAPQEQKWAPGERAPIIK